MGLFNLLFGKRAKAVPPTVAGSSTSALPANDRAANAKQESRPAAPSSEAENLRRWRESGQPRAWVDARKGQWNHAEWLELLETLQRSAYWPLEPAEIGKVLEEFKRGWQRRN